MRYIMITCWNGHWDNLERFANRTFFTGGMLKDGMSQDKLQDGTETIFIKKGKTHGNIEQCWIGKVFDFKNKFYKGTQSISFRIGLEKTINCPDKYRNYSEGWYYENVSEPIVKSKHLVQSKPHDVPYGWKDIEKELDISKNKFGRQINFVKDNFKRKIIFRDVEQAYILSKLGFSKPAAILSGGVIEELLRLFLLSKNENVKNKSFEDLIQLCQEKGFMKTVIGDVASGVRRFRNSVHLSTEKNKKNSISKATASATVALIFTIANDFQGD